MDTGFVEELFGSRSNLIDFLSQMAGKDLPIIETRFGDILGKINTHEGKRLRGELLVRLKDWGGLTYGEINKIPPFDRLKQGSLGKLYLDAKARLHEDDQKK